MCELAISVVDKTSPDPAVDSKLVKRGVVIEVFEDDHGYGRMELTHPMFRILKLPGVPMAVGRGLLGDEIGDPATQPHLLHRQFKLDLDHPDIAADLRAHLDDDSRAAPHIVVDADLIARLKTRRPSVTRDIGQPRSVIG